MQDRRRFLATALTAAPLFVPRSAWGANDRLAYGLIGSGGRGRYLQGNFQKLGAECVAIAEVYDRNLESALKTTPDAKTYVDYHDLLAQSGLDAVVVATPDHQHAPCLFAALDAKKDVYLEKPMSHSIEESQRMIQAVRKTDRIVQIGMQRRSAPAVIKAKKVFDSGILGKITMAKPMWNWNVSKPLDNSPLPGKLDWKRFLGKAQRPRPGAHAFPLLALLLGLLRRQHDRPGHPPDGRGAVVQRRRLRQVRRVLRPGSQEHRQRSARRLLRRLRILQPDGHLDPELLQFLRQRLERHVPGRPGHHAAQQRGLQDLEGTRGSRIPTPVKEMAAPIPIEPHIQNFMDCVKSRQQPNAPVEVGASAVSAPHLANVAFHSDRRARLSADGTKVS